MEGLRIAAVVLQHAWRMTVGLGQFALYRCRQAPNVIVRIESAAQKQWGAVVTIRRRRAGHQNLFTAIVAMENQ
jgi:hypothetical protein